MLKINVVNKEKLKAALEEVEKRATVRTATVSDILHDIDIIENYLVCLLPKKDWQGLKFLCDPSGQNFPGAYKGIPESTQYQLERGASGWFVTALYRRKCHGPTQKIMPLNVTDKSQEIVDFVSQSKNWTT